MGGGPIVREGRRTTGRCKASNSSPPCGKEVAGSAVIDKAGPSTRSTMEAARRSVPARDESFGTAHSDRAGTCENADSAICDDAPAADVGRAPAFVGSPAVLSTTGDGASGYDDDVGSTMSAGGGFVLRETAAPVVMAVAMALAATRDDPTADAAATALERSCSSLWLWLLSSFALSEEAG
ncbi:unnamed protein product [Ixodes hexagonus]